MYHVLGCTCSQLLVAWGAYRSLLHYIVLCYADYASNCRIFGVRKKKVGLLTRTHCGTASSCGNILHGYDTASNLSPNTALHRGVVSVCVD